MAQKRKKNPGKGRVAAGPADPGQFTHDYRLQTISLREIVLAFKRSALDIETYRDRDGVDRVLTVGTLLNALALAFVELPPARRREVALAAVARLEAFRDSLGRPAGDDAGDATADGPDPGRRVGRSAVGRAHGRKSG